MFEPRKTSHKIVEVLFLPMVIDTWLRDVAGERQQSPQVCEVFGYSIFHMNLVSDPHSV
jgi:hypothetical protein